MIESSFEYTSGLINKINKISIKKYNAIVEIAMFIILLGAGILFITHNTIMGVIASVIFVILLISLILSNMSINRSNHVLIGQAVKVVFNDDEMSMLTTLGNKVLYKAKFEYAAVKSVKEYKDLVFIYFNKTSAVIVPKTSFRTSQDCQKAVELVSNNYTV